MNHEEMIITTTTATTTSTATKDFRFSNVTVQLYFDCVSNVTQT